jgi:hypothetical protein
MIFKNTKDSSDVSLIADFPIGFAYKHFETLNKSEVINSFYKQIQKLDSLLTEQSDKFGCQLELTGLQLGEVPVIGFKEDFCYIIDTRIENKKPTSHKDSFLIADVDLMLLKWQMQAKIQPPLVCVNFGCNPYSEITYLKEEEQNDNYF